MPWRAPRRKRPLGAGTVRRGRPEAAEQEALVVWLKFRGLRFCAVPNGGWRNKATAMALSRQGVIPGVPDLLIFTRPPALPAKVGFALELKAPDGPKTARGHQLEWLQALAALGWEVALCRGATEAIARLTAAGY